MDRRKFLTSVSSVAAALTVTLPANKEIQSRNLATVTVDAAKRYRAGDHLHNMKIGETDYVRWAEDDVYSAADSIKGNYSAADTTITVDHPEYFREGDILHIPRTGENVWVDRLDKKELHWVRGVGSTPTPIQDGDAVWILGSYERVPSA